MITMQIIDQVAVREVSKQSRQLVLPRNPYYSKRLAMYNFAVFDLLQFRIGLPRLPLVAGRENKNRMD
jgi:hypothetical protein